MTKDTPVTQGEAASALVTAPSDELRADLWALILRHKLDKFPGFVDNAIDAFLSALAAPAPTQQGWDVWAAFTRAQELIESVASGWSETPRIAAHSAAAELREVRAALSGASPTPQPELTDEQISLIKETVAGAAFICGFTNTEQVVDATLEAVRSLLAASPAQAPSSPPHPPTAQEPAGYVTAIAEGKVLMLPRASLNTDGLVPLYASPTEAMQGKENQHG